MIHLLINTLAEKMNDFLSSYYERAEIIVEAGSIEATPAEDQSDKKQFPGYETHPISSP